jgi:hypothetical protein
MTWGDFPVSIQIWESAGRLAHMTLRTAMPMAVVLMLGAPRAAVAQAVKAGEIPVDVHPAEIPNVELAPTLKTIPVPKDRPSFNYEMVNTSLLPRDKQGIWVLDFYFKKLRIRTVEVQKGSEKIRKQVYYLYYRVVNRTGKPRMFVPQFVMVNESGKKFEDNVVPEAIPIIRTREDQSIPVLGAVNIMGMLPPSTKPDVDDAVYGVATWETWDPKSDRFSVYVRGLSDGYKEVPKADGGKPVAKYKTLKIDFLRRGDQFNIAEQEIELADPPYEWVYW